jgi:hypothetical protein
MEVQVRQDSKRGCGWRKPGGMYLVADGPGRSCGKLPLPLERCPTCNGGIKPTRGWTWVESGPILNQATCSNSKVGGPFDSVEEWADSVDKCLTCPLSLKDLGRVGLLWIGGKFYETPDDFTRESVELGISRRISAVPKDFIPGETWVLLAHRDGIKRVCGACQGEGLVIDAVANSASEGEMPLEGAKRCGDCDGLGFTMIPAIFSVFRPSAIEYVVKGDETDEELESLGERSITPVRVERVKTEGDEDDKPTERGTSARPAATSTTGRVWEIADSLRVNGNLPTRKEVVAAAVAQGINKATAGTQYGRWRKMAEAVEVIDVKTPELRINFQVSRPLPRVPHKKRRSEFKNDYVVMVGEAANMDDPEFFNTVKHAVSCKYPTADGWHLEGFAPVIEDADTRQ